MKLLFALLLATPAAHAATIGSCDGLDKIENMIGAAKSLDIGAKLAYVSTEEPAAAPDHLLVFTYGDDDYSQCVAINAGPNDHGFGSIDLEHAVIKKSLKKVLIKLPVTVSQEDGSKAKRAIVKILITSGYPAPAVSILK